MAEPQIDDSPISLPDSSAPLLTQGTQQSTAISDNHRRIMKAGTGRPAVSGSASANHGASLLRSRGRPRSNVQRSHELTAQVEKLKQEQGMPATVLSRYRNSIGYIYGVYQVGFANQLPEVRAHISGTGFVVGDCLVATNHHLAEPWYGDSEAEALIHRGPWGLLGW